LTRVHLEEDTGKLMHAAGGLSEVDLNRAGIPLLEIVTEPDIRSAADARASLEELRLTLRYLGVSDCEMQEGSLRCDANVNLHIHKDGVKIATPIVEIKNLNSFRSVEKALLYEVDRQYQKWIEDGLTIKDAPKTTRGWNDVEEVTKPQREKETAADYRYFPEPDLVPVVVDEPWLARIRQSIGELPDARRERFEAEYGLSEYDANVLVEQGQDIADYYDSVARATGEYKLASNWIQQDVLRTIKEKKMTVAAFPVRPDGLADLIHRVKRGEVNTNQGREILGRMIQTGDPADVIIEMGGYKMVSDRDQIVAAVAAAIAANPQAIDELRKGKKKPEAVKGFLRGQVMKQTGGKANPALVGELLESLLAEMQL
jgi:aspartyl-tRNA(Asn)/glutamyl-tRNA(Gln) amidotransferase subunit B